MAHVLSILLLLGLLAASPAKEKTPENYCEQEASWKAWQELMAKYPADQGIQTLHALRIGICVKVRHHELSVQQGTEIFEKARQALLLERYEAAQNQVPQLLEP